MSLPLAAAGAMALALVELSVAPYLKIAGLKPDLVLIVVIAIASVVGLERALGWAFVGGLMLDLLSGGPEPPLGATAFTLLLIAALAAAASRIVPGSRAVTALVLVLAGAIVYHLVILLFLSLNGVSAADPLGSAIPLALLDAVIAVPFVIVAVSLSRRDDEVESLGW